ncbi:MAG: class I tRNA ligase family protein, partial [Nanoarchaeota archaeon]|nr:class I tRNA ligase family protein [Nanoarchaeota archaeon]
KEVPIKAHPYAKEEFGSGLVMMCSFGDLTDIRFFRENGIEPIIAINVDGKMNKNADFLENMNIKEARKKIIEMLKEKNLLVKTEKIKQRAPICERSKDGIEFIALEEYYLKQLEYKDKILGIAKKINFYDDSSRQILIDWINCLSEDWPLSRRRYYATPIPLWKCKKCNAKIVGKKGEYHQPWKTKKKCKCGNIMEGETRVFDTWFDSSISPLYILGYERHKEFFTKSFPCTLRPQGKEIVRTWLYYTLLRVYQLTKKPVFKDVWINFHILDEKGRKMSKRLNNIVDPLKVIETSGSEAFRLWSVIEGNLTKQDFQCSEERISAEFKTLIKLWNVAKFISSFELKSQPKLSESDKLMINYINSLIEFSDKKYSEYNFFEPAIKLRHFLWEIFASHYIELVKSRAYNSENKFTKSEQAGAIYTLHYCLKNLLQLFSPIIPAITYKIYDEIYKKDVHNEKFPKSSKAFAIKAKFESLLEINSQVWKMKKDKGLSLKASVKKIELPKKYENLKGLILDLKAAHNSNEVVFSGVKEVKIKF